MHDYAALYHDGGHVHGTHPSSRGKRQKAPNAEVSGFGLEDPLSVVLGYASENVFTQHEIHNGHVDQRQCSVYDAACLTTLGLAELALARVKMLGELGSLEAIAFN